MDSTAADSLFTSNYDDTSRSWVFSLKKRFHIESDRNVRS